MALKRTNRIQGGASSLSELVRPGVNKEIARAIPTSKMGEPAIQFQANHTEIYTYFTQVGGSRLLYSSEGWIRVRMKLETAGPVAIGTRQEITPVLSGRGILLDTDGEYETVLAKGDRLFMASETVNRVKFTVEPIPFLGQIAFELAANTRGVINALKGVAGVVSAARPSSSPQPTTTKSKKTVEELPCPPAGVQLPKLRRGPKFRR